jgi:hypothetical protein
MSRLANLLISRVVDKKGGEGMSVSQINTSFSGFNCDIDDPCLENKTCPVGSLCYGNCEPNVVCEAATGTAHCRGCVAGWTGLHCEVDVDECKGG